MKDGYQRSQEGSRVVLVGAGIVNLLTAERLAASGALVEVLDAGPDPRCRPEWQRLGATHGGGNARMFSATEADCHHERTVRQGTVPDDKLSRRVTEGGWLLHPSDRLSTTERAWIDNFRNRPAELAEVFARDIYRFNLDSGRLWVELRRQTPELFRGVAWTEGVLRVYAHSEKVEAARELYGDLGVLQRVLGPSRLGRHHPAFREAVDRGEIAGGVEIEGFTLAIHDFVDRLLEWLEGRGVRLGWNRPVSTLERAADGCVVGLRTVDGELVRSDHYVLSPGATSSDLLDGTRSAGKIQGILGVWLLLPHLEPRLRQSVKIHRRGHVGEDANLILADDESGRPILVLGSGYGFLGGRPLDTSSDQIAELFRAVEDLAQRFLPRAHARAVREGTLFGDRRSCVRPFTSTGLGIFEVDRTADGGALIIASGHNTGGFTQAPVVAEAVAATLEGREHPMQTLYDPERGVLGAGLPPEPSAAGARDRLVAPLVSR